MDEVIAFWFEGRGRADWFRKSAELDAEVTSRFAALLERLSKSPVDALSGDAVTALAAIVVLDQFSRNIHRDDPLAFGADPLARAISDVAVERGFDAATPVERRLFFYLPFEHSENEADQVRAVALISALGDSEYTRYAIAHAEVIRRFGRFPHRNGVLGRKSTPDEVAYLAEPGSGF